MNVEEINNVSNRRRLNAEAQRLREKVSRETAKIIKLKVAQDTAYWDLKEKLQQVEGNHERLQQNMVEVQMQHEAISGQYQDELRLRPETLNKLSSTREICEVLEDYSERLKQTLCRSKEDQTALCDAYQRSGLLVKDIKTKQLLAADQNRQVVQALEEKVKLASEHQSQLMQVFSASRQQAEGELGDLRSRLEAALQTKDQLATRVNDLTRKLDKCKFDLDKKDENISNLQRDMKQLIQEFNAQAAEARNTLEKQENDLKEAMEANNALKTALSNQEEFTKSVCEQNSGLQEKLALMEEQRTSHSEAEREMNIQLEKTNNMYEQQKQVAATLKEEKEKLLKEIGEKEQLLLKYKEEIENVKLQMNNVENDKCEILARVNRAEEELKTKADHVEELTAEVEALLRTIQELENKHQTYCETSEQKIKELSTQIESRDKELDSKAAAITQLMSELKLSTDVRARLETALQNTRKDMETDREVAREKERKMVARVEQLETVVRDKEDELSKQMSIILEMRNEKERLQEKIASMQGTIDNIQKELTGRPKSTHRDPPDLDDNAVMLTPTHQKPAPAQSSPTLAAGAQFATPREPPLDPLLFTLLSDSSVDGDTLDSSEVNRRFAAMSRGERVSPLPMTALKRRSAVPAAQGHKFRAAADARDAPISLSQVKNEMKNKERSFFKTKRVENKTKKTK